MKALRVLAIVQTAVYLTLFVLLAWPGSDEGGSFLWGDGIKVILVAMYAAGGPALFYSAVIFTDFGNKLDLVRLKRAKMAQKTLFICCCVALLPLVFISMSNMMEYTILLLATLVGVVFFPIMLTLVNRAGVNADPGETWT